MATDKLPCGLYRTQKRIGDAVPAGALVYYHNHGDPGPGVYLPSGWKNNRAKFHKNGKTVPDPQYADSLVPLADEGLYRVAEAFHCCKKKCFAYHEGQLVQLGYNGKAQPLLFVPQWVDDELELPTSGTRIDDGNIDKLQLLKVARGEGEPSAEEASLLN